MIFPLDVNKVVVDSKKLAGENKIQAAIAACILGSFFLYAYFIDILSCSAYYEINPLYPV